MLQKFTKTLRVSSRNNRNAKILKNSVICVSLPWDNTMMEGKWRVLSKPYQLIHKNEANSNTKKIFEFKNLDVINKS